MSKKQYAVSTIWRKNGSDYHTIGIFFAENESDAKMQAIDEHFYNQGAEGRSLINYIAEEVTQNI